MCGNDCIEKISSNWCSHLPNILKYGNHEVPENLTEGDAYRGIKVMDKAFRPPGAGAKSPAALFIYEVQLNCECVVNTKYCAYMCVYIGFF